MNRTTIPTISYIRSESRLNLSHDYNDTSMPIQEFLLLQSISRSKSPNNQLFTSWQPKQITNVKHSSMLDRQKRWTEKRSEKIVEAKNRQDKKLMEGCTFKPKTRSKPPLYNKAQNKGRLPAPKLLGNFDILEHRQRIFCTKKYTSLSPYQVKISKYN